MKKRNEVDGLRAVAVIPVILFHAGFSLFSGGFVGVDVFFVISGYLITGIIYEETRNGTFSIYKFYDRRIRRIMPALFVVCVTCIPFAWMWMLPDEFQDFSESLIAINLFSSNILFWLESGYFARAAELKPLLHTWSLSVEEQFYLFFPPFLLLCRGLARASLLTILIIASILSLALAEWLSGIRPGANFYLLPTRAWELGVGAILAISAPHWQNINPRIAAAGALAGLALVLYSIFAFDSSIPFPGLWACIPVFGTALIIAFANPSNLTGKLLSWAPFVGIGLVSYSAYLWHQPLFAFARIRLLDGVTPATYLALGAASLGLAYLSWKFVEQPFRNRTKIPLKKVFGGAVLASAVLIIAGLIGPLTNGMPSRLPPEAQEMVRWAEDRNADPCKTRRVKPEERCFFGSEDPQTAVWGDSHAMSLVDSIGAFGGGARDLTCDSGVPAPGLARNDGRWMYCSDFHADALEYLKAPDTEKIVVMSARLTGWFEGFNFDNQEGGVEHGDLIYAVPRATGAGDLDDPERIDAVGKIYRNSVTELLEAGKKVVVIYPIPEVGWNVPRHLAQLHMFGKVEKPLSTSHALYRERTRNTKIQLDLLEDHPNLIRIYPEELLCDTIIPDRCAAEMDGKPLYYDDDHLNLSIGAPMLGEQVQQSMKQAGWM